MASTTRCLVRVVLRGWMEMADDDDEEGWCIKSRRVKVTHWSTLIYEYDDKRKAYFSLLLRRGIHDIHHEIFMGIMVT